MYLTAEDFDEPPHQVGTVTLPHTYGPNRKEYRNDVARRLRTMKAEPSPSTKRRRRSEALADSHPVARDPDLRTKLSAASQADRIDREIMDLERRVSGKNTSLANEFDRVLDVLATYGYLHRDSWTLTDVGEVLARTFHESDLLVVEIVRSGVSTASAPRTWPRWCRRSCTNTGPRSLHRRRGSRRARSVTAGDACRRSVRICARPNALSDSPSIGRRIRPSRPSRTRGWQGRGLPRWSATTT
jgi:hypothetical protein